MLWGKGFGGVILLVVSTSICCSLLFTQATAGLEMSWRCSGRTNAELVNNLFRNGIIKNERVKGKEYHVPERKGVASFMR